MYNINNHIPPTAEKKGLVLKMDKVRFGIVGFGNMGSGHAKNLMAGKVKNAELTAICDIKPAKIEAAKALYPDCHKRVDREYNVRHKSFRNRAGGIR